MGQLGALWWNRMNWQTVALEYLQNALVGQHGSSYSDWPEGVAWEWVRKTWREYCHFLARAVVDGEGGVCERQCCDGDGQVWWRAGRVECSFCHCRRWEAQSWMQAIFTGIFIRQRTNPRSIGIELDTRVKRLQMTGQATWNTVRFLWVSIRSTVSQFDGCQIDTQNHWNGRWLIETILFADRGRGHKVVRPVDTSSKWLKETLVNASFMHTIGWMAAHHPSRWYRRLSSYLAINIGMEQASIKSDEGWLERGFINKDTNGSNWAN